MTFRGVNGRDLSVYIRPSKLFSRPSTRHAGVGRRLDDGADDRVEAGSVAATGEDTNLVHGRHGFPTINRAPCHFALTTRPTFPVRCPCAAPHAKLARVGTCAGCLQGARPDIGRLIRGRLAQLGERRVRNAEVRSSILLPSTNFTPCFPKHFSDFVGRRRVLLCGHGRLCPDCDHPWQVQRSKLPLFTRVRVALEHPRRRVARNGHHGVIVEALLDHPAQSGVPKCVERHIT